MSRRDSDGSWSGYRWRETVIDATSLLSVSMAEGRGKDATGWRPQIHCRAVT